MNKNLKIFLIVLVGLAVLFFAIVGLNYDEIFSKTVSKSEKRKSLEKKNVNLKKKSKNLSIIYSSIRISIVIIFSIFVFLLFFFGFIENLDDFMNTIELVFLITAIYCFLRYGKFSIVKDRIKKAEEYIKLRIYGQYANIDEEILKNSEEIERLSSSD